MSNEIEALRAELARELAAREAAERDLADLRVQWNSLIRNAPEQFTGLRDALAAERVANAGLREALINHSCADCGCPFRSPGAVLYDCPRCRDIRAALSAAPPLPMGALRAASVEMCVWFVDDGKERCGAPATWRLEPVSDESHDELSGADGGGGMPPLRLCDRHFGASRTHKNKRRWAAERISSPASVPPVAAPQERVKAAIAESAFANGAAAPQEQQGAEPEGVGLDADAPTRPSDGTECPVCHDVVTAANVKRHALIKNVAEVGWLWLCSAQTHRVRVTRTPASAASEPKAPLVSAPIVQGEEKK